MRGVVLILVTLQLLLNGVAHSCFHVPVPGGAGHQGRPHIHLAGHSHHSHHAGHVHGGHGHSHGIADEKPAPADVAAVPMKPEHDQDAVYLSWDFASVPVPRTIVPKLNIALATSVDWSAFPPTAGHPLTQHLIERRSDPVAGYYAQRMPHQLRV